VHQPVARAARLDGLRLLRGNNLEVDHAHEIDSVNDLGLLLEAGLGIAILGGPAALGGRLCYSGDGVATGQDTKIDLTFSAPREGRQLPCAFGSQDR